MENKQLTKYDKFIADDLKDNQEYLQYFIKMTIKRYQRTKNLKTFLRNLKLISIAQKGGINQISKETSVARKTLYNIFDNKNFTFNNFSKLLNTLDIEINFRQHQRTS
ncbi:MAG: hypothetical protein LBF97_03290 [Elusimicrobiota bacterium]|jgi:DNA-binding phage protein|nr:hypothetical protein [Elusimicrobiota bacterium]